MKIGRKIAFRIVIPILLGVVFISYAYYRVEKSEELDRLVYPSL